MSALRREYKPRPPRPYRNRLGLSGGTSVDRRSGGTPDPRPGPGLEQAGRPFGLLPVPRALARLYELGPTRHSIQSFGPIDPRKGREAADFGQGFYTTTYKRQARHWAWKRYYDIPASKVGPPGVPLQPVVLKFRLRLEDLAPKESLHFVLGDYDDERFWSLVQYCRQSTADVPRTHLHPRDPTAGMIS